MIISFFVECEDCKRKYRVRYGVGNNYPQKASFNCKSCSGLIETGLKKYDGDQFLIGATIINDKNLFSKNIEVINLYSDLSIEKEDLHNPFHIQSIKTFQRLDKESKDVFGFKGIQSNWSLFYDQWDKLKSPLRILANKGENELKSISRMTVKEFSRNFNDWILLFLQGEYANIYENVCDEYNSINSSQIKTYFRSSKSKYIRLISEVCKTYMNVSDQLQATYFNEVYDWETTPDTIPNVNWEELESIYGDLYEVLGDLFVLPTLINNLISGRKFDEFQTAGFTLEKYLQTDKANRHKNFESNPNLETLHQFYFSWLRNGTHHKNSSLNESTFEVNLGTSKGGTVSKKIPLIKYVESCNRLFASGLILSSIILHQMR